MTVLLYAYTWTDSCVLPVTHLKQVRCLAVKPGGARAPQTHPQEGFSPSPPSALSFGPAEIHSSHSNISRATCACNNLAPSTYLQNKPRSARQETGNCLSNLIFFTSFLFWGLSEMCSVWIEVTTWVMPPCLKKKGCYHNNLTLRFITMAILRNY